MAETILSALVHVLLEKSSQVFQECSLFSGISKEIRKLQSVLSTIQAVLEDAEDQQVMDKAVRIWLIKLKDVAYDADDLLDEYMTKDLSRKLDFHDHKELPGCIANEVRYLCSRSNPIFFCYRMKNKLKKIVEKLNAIADERLKYHLREKFVDLSKQSSGKLQSDSYIFESEIIGRCLDKEKILTFLMNSSRQGDISVMPIVGMGGLGKTTLAKSVYNDKRVEEHFDQRIWVCVSRNFNVKRLLRAIVESVTGTRCDLQEMEAIHQRVQELLIRRRFLLVLDDVWNDDHENWERLKNSVRHGCEGNKILVTTRSQKVALVMGTVMPYHLDGLSEDDCWRLFKQRAFKNREPKETLHLLPIGREIARKCKGVPLAAKALGSLMYLKRRKCEWLYVKNSQVWNLVEEENGILPVLKLSYDNLPSHLKQCFAYCSLFPKDYRINKEKLIHLWMAEGFVQSSHGKLLEEVGNDYFNELFWRSFFHNATRDSDGSIVECEMHHLLQDLAKSVAGASCVTVEARRKVSVPSHTRHLSIVCTETKIPKGSKSACSLRSFLLLFGHRKIIKVSRNLILSFESLHTLDLSGTGIKELSNSIGAVKHLRYLDLSETLIKVLPNSICSLFNLQCLILKHCNRLEKLPADTRKLINTRHLNIYGCESLIQLPNGIGELKSLRTLPVFIAGKKSACSIAELQSLDLHGELKIKKLENVMDVKLAKSANLKDKRNLQSLELQWDRVNEVNARENFDSVIEGLQPSSEVKELHIENYMGSKFPCWLMNPYLTNLVVLSLIRCRRCVQLPALRKLWALEVLYIDEMDGVMYFCSDSESRGVNDFALLQKLSLKNMPNLLGWSVVEGRDLLPCLKQLVVKGCPNLVDLPDLPSIDSVELDDCSVDLLRVVTKLPSLSSLIIGCFPELVHLPQGLLTKSPLLMSLEIRDCPKMRLISGELKTLCALQSLSISNCYQLELLSDLGSLSSLKSLAIDRCHNLILFPDRIKGLESLQYLSLSNLENLMELPENMKHLTGLETLHVWSCSRISQLPEWLGRLISLRELELWYCENILGLPESMKRLTALQFLSIWSCPRLEIHCEKGTGADWNKIQHIPFIKVNGPYIQAMHS